MQLDLQYSVAADAPFLFLIAGSLPFLPLGETPGVAHVFVEPVNDGFSDAIAIPEGFPFGGSIETEAYVSCCSIRAVGSGAAGAAQAAPLFMPIFFFRRRFNFRVPRYHAPLECSVRVRRGPRHYELAVCLFCLYGVFFA